MPENIMKKIIKSVMKKLAPPPPTIKWPMPWGESGKLVGGVPNNWSFFKRKFDMADDKERGRVGV